MKKRSVTAILKILAAVFCLPFVFTACSGRGDNGPTGAPDGRETEPPATEEPSPAEKYDWDPDSYGTGIYPYPKSVNYTPGTEPVTAGPLFVNGDGATEYCLKAFEKYGFELVSEKENGFDTLLSVDNTLSDEEYRIDVDNSGIRISASGDRGFFWAVNTLSQLRNGDALPVISVSDSPDVPFRGVIEGFYGTAWSHSFRLELMEFMGRNKMNTYIYAPKDDPKHRSKWREGYTEEEAAKLREFVDAARANNVKFVYAISPGLDFKLGSGYEKDFAALCEKCESVYNLGVRNFAVLLDDIPTLDAKGHAKLLNDFQERFVETHEGMDDLIVITPEYCTAFLTEYTSEIAPLLNEKLIVMWTGDMVASANLSAALLRSINNKLGRKVFIWWNYPVNDTMQNNLFMGPCETLRTNLKEAVTGLTANPMNQGHASYLPLATTGDFLWNTAAYDAEQSFAAAAKRIAPGYAKELTDFADLMRGSLINNNKSSLSISPYISSYNKGTLSAEDRDVLIEKLAGLLQSLKTLREKGDKKLIAEISRWIEKAEDLVRMAKSLFELEKAVDGASEMPSTDKLMEIASGYVNAKSHMATNESIVSPDVLSPLAVSSAKRVNTLLGGSSEAGPKSVKTNLATYQTYKIDYACDRDDTSFFWSAGAPASGSYITLDLGSVREISRVILHMGTNEKPDDYIRSGRIDYSVDGSSWTKIKNISDRNMDIDVSIEARYLRVTASGNQQNWAIVREFNAVSSGGEASFDAKIEPAPAVETDITPLFDGNMLTVFSPDPTSVKNRALTMKVSGLGKVALYFSALPSPDSGFSVYLQKADGSRSDPVTLSYVTLIDVSGYDKLTVSFGNGPFSMTEIKAE